MKEQDGLKFPAAGTHLCGTYLDSQMEQYIHKRKHGGISIMNLKRTWEELLLVACAIFANENPAGDRVISSRMLLPLELLFFRAASPPAPFTTQIQTAYQEPRLLVVTDSRAAHQPLTETSLLACLPTTV